MKKIVVNKDACIGCGACVAIDPDHFEFDDNGLSSVINNENIESEGVTTAIESCPTNAISLDESDCDCNDGCNCDEKSECCGECHCDKK